MSVPITAGSVRSAGVGAPVVECPSGSITSGRVELVARVTGFLHRVQDPSEIVGLGCLQRREGLVGQEFLLPKLLADRQHVPVIQESGNRATERTADAVNGLLTHTDRLLEGVALDVLDQGEVKRREW